MGADGHGTHGHDPEGVAIGLRSCQCGCSNVATCACAVVHHYGLSQSFTEALGQVSGHQISHATRWKWNDQGDGFHWIGACVLCKGKACDSNEGEKYGNCSENSFHHLMPLNVEAIFDHDRCIV